MAEKSRNISNNNTWKDQNRFLFRKSRFRNNKKVKEAVKIPVIGNGDIVDEQTALEMFEKTGVDGIMIGRGTFGNPWIFKKISHFLQTGEKLPETPLEERLQILEKHINLELKSKPEIVAIRELRKPISWYTKGLKDSSEFRDKINKIEK